MNTAVIRLNAIVLPPPPRTAFWRFVWKELRTLRSFWLAMTGLAIAGLWLTTKLVDPGSDLPSILFASALCAGVTFAVGAAATLFAVEHEEETYGFLSALPSGWSPMFWGKLFAAGSSATALAMVLSLVVVAMAGHWPGQTKALEIGGLFGLAIPEVLVWGALFSLLLKRPLVAALLAICAELVAAQLVINMIPALFIPGWYMQSYLSATPFRLGIILVVLTVDLWLVRRWWPVDRRAPVGNESFADAPAVLTKQNFFALSDSPKLRMMGRLAWQTLRQSWSMMAWMLVLVFVIQSSISQVLAASIQNWAVWQPSLLILSMALPILGPALYASAIFHADHRRQSHSFLAGHAVSGSWVWFCRLLVWAVVFTIPMVILPAVLQWWTTDHFSTMVLFNYSWNVFFGFAIGQFCALMIRQTLVAAFLAVLLSYLVAVWMQIVLALELPFWGFVMPVPLGLLFASWLRAPNWIAQRNRISGWSQVALAIVLPIGLVVVSIPSTRLAQVPESEVELLIGKMDGIVLKKAKQLEARLAGDQILQRCRSISASILDENMTGELVTTANREQLQPVIDRCQRPPIRFSNLDDFTNSLEIRAGSNLDALGKMMTLLADMGKQASAHGELDQALEDYLAWWRLYGFLRSGQTIHVNLQVTEQQQLFAERMLLWAKHESQSSARIKQAIRQLDRLPPWALSRLTDSNDFPPNPEENLWAEHDQLLDVLEDRRQPHAIHGSANIMAAWMNKLPFERQRAVRILTVLTSERMSEMHQVLKYLRPLPNDTSLQPADSSARPTSSTYHAEQLRLAIRKTYQAERQRTSSFESRLSYPLESWLRTSYLLKNEYQLIAQDEYAFLRQLVNSAVRHTGLKTQLALIAYWIDHDEYPETLDPLTPDYMSQGAIDPYSGRLFEYRPEGIPEQIQFGCHAVRDQGTLQPGTPFFWSVGPGKVTLKVQEVRLGEYGGAYGDGGYGGGGGYGGEEFGGVDVYGVKPGDSPEMEIENELKETKPDTNLSKIRTEYMFCPQESYYGSIAPFVFQLPNCTAPLR